MRSATERREIWENKWKKGSAATSYYIHFVRDDEDISGKVVLNIGCGNQHLVDTEPAKKYVGLDISSNALNKVRWVSANTELIREDAANLPFKDNEFDTVISIQTISALGDVAYQVLKEAARVLKPAGSLIFDVTHSDWLFQNAFKEEMISTVEMQHGTLFTFRNGSEEQCCMGYDNEGIQKLLEELGLKKSLMKVLNSYEFSYLGIPAYQTPPVNETSDINRAIFVMAQKG